MLKRDFLVDYQFLVERRIDHIYLKSEFVKASRELEQMLRLELLEGLTDEESNVLVERISEQFFQYVHELNKAAYRLGMSDSFDLLINLRKNEME